MFLLDVVPYIPTTPDVAPDPGIFYGLAAAAVVAIIVILIIFLKKKWSFFTNNKIRKSWRINYVFTWFRCHAIYLRSSSRCFFRSRRTHSGFRARNHHSNCISNHEKKIKRRILLWRRWGRRVQGFHLRPHSPHSRSGGNHLPRYLMGSKAKLNSNSEKAENSTEEKAECVETV